RWSWPPDWFAFQLRAIVLGLGLSFLWLMRPRWRSRAFAAVVLVLWSLETVTVQAALRDWDRSVHEQDFGRWLRTQIGRGTTIAIVGPRSGFERHIKGDDPDIWNWASVFGVSKRQIFVAEAVGGYDVRMVPRLDLLEE